MELPHKALLKCHVCGRIFTVKSNLTRHLKTHSGTPAFKCSECSKVFNLKQQLDRHKKTHLHPVIPLYNPNEVKLQRTKEADTIGSQATKEAVDNVWLKPETAEAEAKRQGGDLWQTCVRLSWGRYEGQSFKWLLENDVGYVVWLVACFRVNGEEDPLMSWQKQTLLDLVRQFPLVMDKIDKRVKRMKQEKEPAPTSGGDKKAPQTSETPFDPFPDDEDAEILAAAEAVLHKSPVDVETVVTDVGRLASSSEKSATDQPSTDLGSDIILEGWQKSWETPSAHGNIEANIHWMKGNAEHGLYNPAKPYKVKDGQVTLRKLFKDRMWFTPPPVPASMMGLVPSMFAFFSTPVFFWRPVGVMQAKIRCPNKDCPAPPDSYLVRHGYSTIARQVCSEYYYYTLLTERLVCYPCEKLRHTHGSGDSQNRQYIWHATSPMILMGLSPAVRAMLPAIICGKRTIDKSVVTLLDDRLNAVSMSKVQRLLQQQHDKWYAERRDLYQTLLYEAYTAKSAKPNQTGILQFVKPSGSFTPPIPQPPIPGERVLRRAHLIQEMEKMPDYRAAILSTTGEILCIDGTKQILKKIYGEGRDTMHYVTSILNEWGQFLTTVVVASETEDCYRRLASGLVSRFKRATAPAPKILYTDNNCCRNGQPSFLEVLFGDWVDEGMVVRLDIRHWLHRWDAVVIKQTHAKYPAFISAMAGAVLAYNRDDMMLLVKAVRSGNEAMYASYSDEQMLSHIKPYQLKSYVRRITRGVEETADTVEYILEEFKGPAGLDIDGIPLFTSNEAVDSHWALASKHLSCMQDPPGIQLYVVTKVVKINGVSLNKYRCRRGSNALEGLHSHLINTIPSKRCGIMPFQVYLVSFAVQWNNRMNALRVAGGMTRRSTCTNPRLVQRLNHQSKVLFGKEHLYEANFVAPMALPDQYDDPEEEELLGIEYAMCQSTRFTSKDYYANEVEKEQAEDASIDEQSEEEEEEQEVEEDEGIIADEETDDPMDNINSAYVAMSSTEPEFDDQSPALQDVLSESHLHLPGFAEVENLALALLKLADDGDEHLVKPHVRNLVEETASRLQDHDKTTRSFVMKYESKWGYSLFGRCLGPESTEKSAAQKTRFSTRYTPGAKITEDSRLLYLLIKMLRNRPPASLQGSPSKQATQTKAQYKRIVDRVMDDPVLSTLNLPLPHINNKSITLFIRNEEKKANYKATVVPKIKRHRQVMSDTPLMEAETLPTKLVATHVEIQYPILPHVSGKRHLEKRRLDLEEPQPKRKTSSTVTSPTPISIRPRPIEPADTAPILLVTPSQSIGPKVSLDLTSSQLLIQAPPKPVAAKKIMPGKSGKPCAACNVPKCGGLRQRYTPPKHKVANSRQKIFTFCPTTRKSTTPGFDAIYENFTHFKEVVDEFLKIQKQK